MIEYEKRLEPDQPIGVALLVTGLGCRQTAAHWSFDHLSTHSRSQEIRGGPVSTVARVVDGAVLVAQNNVTVNGRQIFETYWQSPKKSI